jgi:hypothetical protein
VVLFCCCCAASWLSSDSFLCLQTRRRSEDETTLSSCDSSQKRLLLLQEGAGEEETRFSAVAGVGVGVAGVGCVGVEEERCASWREAWQQNERRLAVVPRDYELRLLHVTPKMRAVLLDWLFEVMLEYKLSHKTLQLAVLYVDKFLARHVNTPKSALQLLGVAALLVASKFEDVRPIELASLIWISDEAYSVEQLKEMEKAKREKTKRLVVLTFGKPGAAGDVELGLGCSAGSVLAGRNGRGAAAGDGGLCAAAAVCDVSDASDVAGLERVQGFAALAACRGGAGVRRALAGRAGARCRRAALLSHRAAPRRL